MAHSYGFTGRLYRLRVLDASEIAGKTIAEAQIGSEYELDVVLVLREGTVRRRTLHPTPDLVFEPGDEIHVEGEAHDVWKLAEEQTLQLTITPPDELDRILGRGVTLAEVTLSPRCEVLGKNFKELRFRNHYGLSVHSIWRGDQAITTGAGDVPLALGDAFLVSGPPKRVRQLASDPDYVVLGGGRVSSEDVHRAPIALGLLLLAIVPPLLGLYPLALCALGAALLMVLTGCISLSGARRALDFTILLLIIGTIPLGLALEQTGVAGTLAKAIVFFQTHFGEPGLMASLFLLAAVLSTTSNNGAAAVILAPVAYQAAVSSGSDVRQAFLAVAFGTSCAFILPFAHQCNLMVMGPAGYSTRDFVRVGSILSILMAIVAVTLLSL